MLCLQSPAVPHSHGPDHPFHNCKLDTTLGWEVSETRMHRACVDSQQMLGSKQVQLPTPCWRRACGLETHFGHWTESKRGSSGQRPGSLPRELFLGFSRKRGPISHSYSEGPARCPLNSIPKEALLEHCLVRKKAEQSACQELHPGGWREVLRNIPHLFFSTCESRWMMCVRCFPQESKSQNSYLIEMSPEQHYFIFWAIWLIIIIMMR